MKKAHPDYSVHELCSLFQLSETTYYAQIRPNSIKTEEAMIMAAIKNIAIETGSTYGRRRMKVALAMKGFKFGIYRTATLMKQAAVKAIRPSRKHYYPTVGKAHFIAPNLLERQFNPEQANTHWVGDITYIRTHQGWSYLACVLDLATKKIVGWAMSKKTNADLAKAALSHGIRRQQPDTAKLMFHSDQGVQY
jgi:transposase InsO family protein